MEEPSAWSRQKKIIDRLGLFAIIALVAGVIFLIAHNNPELLRCNPGTENIQRSGVNDRKGTLLESEESSVSAPQRHWVLIDGIECPVSGKPGVVVRMSLVVFFRDQSLRQELLSRRDGLRVLTHKVMTGVGVDEMKTEKVRRALVEEFNGLLDGGKIADIEIRDCEIIEVKTP